jgi:hypothetical protein
MANNPDIRAAQQRWEAAKAFVPQVKTLPDPMLNLGYENVEEREIMYGFSQEIPFPGKVRWPHARRSAWSRNTWPSPCASSPA